MNSLEVNPILGYLMYNRMDRKLANKRNAYGTEPKIYKPNCNTLELSEEFNLEELIYNYE